MVAASSNWTLNQVQREAQLIDHEALSSLAGLYRAGHQAVISSTTNLDDARGAVASAWTSSSGVTATGTMVTTSAQAVQTADAASTAADVLNDVYPTVVAAKAQIASIPHVDTSVTAAVNKAGGISFSNLGTIKANLESADAASESNRKAAISAFNQMDEVGANAAATFTTSDLFPTIPLPAGLSEPTGLPATMTVPPIGTGGSGPSGSGSGGGGYYPTPSRNPGWPKVSSGSGGSTGSGGGTGSGGSGGSTGPAHSGGSGGATPPSSAPKSGDPAPWAGPAPGPAPKDPVGNGNGWLPEPAPGLIGGLEPIVGGGGAPTQIGLDRPRLNLPGSGSASNTNGAGPAGRGNNGLTGDGSGGRSALPTSEPEPSTAAATRSAAAASESELAAGRGGAGMSPMAGGGRHRGDEEDELKKRPKYLKETEDIFGDYEAGAKPPVIG
jgi:hypothetical protein